MGTINSAASIRYPRTVEQGKTRWPEGAVQAKRDLGDPRSLANLKQRPRADAIQLGGGQQASSLRFGSAACARRLSRSEHGISGADPAAKDAAAGAVRNYRTHAGRGIGLDQEIGVEFRRLPIPEPNSEVTPSVYPPIRPNC